MILHAASIAALLADQLAQAPVQIQCVQQSTPDSWLRWLLPTIVQTAISLVSIGVGVGIAVWSFRRNRQSENEQWVRNQKAGHDQWVRDQKKVEWREILVALNQCQNSLSVISIVEGHLRRVSITASKEIDEQYSKVLRAQQTIFDRLFIDAITIDPVMAGWTSLTKAAREMLSGDVLEIANRHLALVNLVRNQARKDLGAEGVAYLDIKV
jgi:hypothetical protein